MNPILIESYRGETLESFHRGVVCIVNEKGNIIASLGDPTQICYPRSTLKLFQHVPLLMSDAIEKYGITEEEIAVMCGSHNGEEAHLEAVTSILAKADVDVKDLGCGAHMPELREDRINLYSKNEKPSHLHNNCSGKHAGFLLYCKHKGYDLRTYLNPDHPLQVEIKEVCANLYEFPIDKLQLGRDGCSAPVYSLPVYNQALAYKNLVQPPAKYAKALEQIVEACCNNPFMVAGSKRYCSALMDVAGDRLVAKTGADGVYCIGLKKQKWGIAIKIDDGQMGPQYLVAQNILQQIGLLNNEECVKLSNYSEEKLINFSKLTIGLKKPSDKLKHLEIGS